MDHIQIYWNWGEEGSGQTSSLFLSVFPSLGLCHSLCTMVSTVHSLGVEFPCIEGTLMHTFLSYSFPWFFSKGNRIPHRPSTVYLIYENTHAPLRPCGVTQINPFASTGRTGTSNDISMSKVSL